MFGHYTMGRILGIPIRLHRSLVWVGLALALFASLDAGLSAGLVQLALIAAVFGIVLLHELGHSVAALSLGIRTHDITLYPFGGIARLERLPREPRREILIALAGPAVNFFLAGVFALVHLFLGPSPLDVLLWINLGLGVFNLLPGFPMDGGRVLRALLATRLPHARATLLAGRIGRVVAVALGVLGLVWAYPMLILVAVFVWLAAGSEMRAAALEERASRSPWSGLFGGRSDPGSGGPGANQPPPQDRVRVIRVGPFVGGSVFRPESDPGPAPAQNDVVIDVGPRPR